MKNSIFTISASLALVGGVEATVLVDNFESYSPIGSTMAGKGNWQVQNGTPLVGGDGPVVILDDSNWAGGGLQAATVGGVQQTALGLTRLYDNSLNVPLVSLTPQPTFFQVETQFAQSTNGFNNPFQFVLTASSGNLLTINLTPDTATTFDVSWSSDFATGSTFGTLDAGVLTSFRLDLTASGPNVGFLFSNGGSTVASGTLTGGALPTDLITEFSVNWNSTGGAGDGFIIVDNVTVIPEPSAALLGLLGASCAFLRRRRA